MNPKRIAQSVDEYISSLGDILEGKVAGAHILGDLKAQRRTGSAIAFNLVKQEALDYTRDYKKLLEEEGATMIKGEKVPWLADQGRELRRKIGDTIETGISEGRSVEDIKRDLQGVWDETDRRLRLVAKNEVATAQSHGSDVRYQELGVDEVDWLLGDKACPTCIAIAAENGGRYKIGQVPYRPVHPGCECDIAPAGVD